MIAYHGKKENKDAILAQLAAHRAADEIIKGQYWYRGKGCAVGCTIHGEDHSLYEPQFGIPQMLARLEDCIFEGLPNAQAQQWPERFMSAIRPGQDLSLVGWKFLHWLLTDEKVNPGITHPLVKDAIAYAAQVICALAKGEKLGDLATENAVRTAAIAASAASAASAAWSATWSAKSAARSAKSAKSATWSAAWSAESAAWSAKSAAWSARSAASAAASAERAARSAASAAWSAKRSRAYGLMADKLIKLIEATE